MGNILDSLTIYLMLILLTLIFVSAVVGGVLFYFIRVKKIASAEEHIDYSTFNRVDATEYVKFKDIISSGVNGNGIGVVSMGNNQFLGGIDITGYNYFSASAEERQRTMINAISAFNVIEQPIQMRQTVQSIDIQRNINEERDCGIKIEKELLRVRSEYNDTLDAFAQNTDNPEIADSIKRRLDRLLRTQRSLEWRLEESKSMIDYMKKVSDSEVTSKKVNQILFSYFYNPADDIEELSPSEIIDKARRELSIMANQIGGAWENCGCSWRVLTADDFTNLYRRHYHPETADDVRLDELLNSSYTALYVSSDSLEELEREKRGDIEYEQQMLAYERAQQQAIEEAQAKFEREREMLQQEVAAIK